MNCKKVVEDGGGVYRGIQSREFMGREPLVLFDDPRGSTLSLPLSKLTVENVGKRLRQEVVE